MTELDKLKQLAGAVTMEAEAQELEAAIVQLITMENICPFVVMRAMEQTLCHIMALQFAGRPDDVFEHVLELMLGSIRKTTTIIRAVEIERRSKGR